MSKDIKNIKTKSPYKVVNAYEDKFKKDFAKSLGEMGELVLSKATQFLKK